MESNLHGRDFFKPEAKSTALLVIDMQNDFVEEGGRITAYPGSVRIIPNIERILSFAREHSMTVVWTQASQGFPYGGLMLKKFPPMAKEKVMWEGTRGFEIYSQMKQPIEGEYRIYKHKYDAFYQTDLELILRNLRIQTVIITGVDTDVCCESTARSAFFREFQVAFISDATSTMTDEAHEATLRAMDNYFGRVMKTDELLSELGESIPVVAANIR